MVAEAKDPIICHILLKMVMWLAWSPYTTVLIMVTISIALAVVGYYTGYYMENDGYILWIPQGSKTLCNLNYIV